MDLMTEGRENITGVERSSVSLKLLYGHFRLQAIHSRLFAILVNRPYLARTNYLDRSPAKLTDHPASYLRPALVIMASDFDAWNQNVTFHFPDGSPFDVPIYAINNFAQYSIRICVNYGAQLGASVILLVILLLLTKSEKRASYVFWLNCLALLLNLARLLCQIIFFTSPFTEAYTYFAADYSRIPASAYANSILSVIFTSLLLTFIEVSLVLQVQVVCANLRRKYRRPLLGMSVIVALIPIAFRYWYSVKNIQSILDVLSPEPLVWLESTCNIVITVSVCFFCAVFVTKLGFAIRLRRKLGLTDFGPMKVIFVMGCQTMVIPAIFSIVHYATDIPELSSNVLTLVTLSLPLSSIWAGTTLEKPGAASSSGRNMWQVLSCSGLKGSRQTSSTSTSSNSAKPCTKCYSDSALLTNGARKTRVSSDASAARYGIAVEHNISIESTRRESFGDV
ncbi:alpha-factor pheromone receptor STE2 [Aspergillus lucknowensis]|uniref:Fungal pheromone mating factor STE2 GPCR-domain-containing protein n=1 Tax=Aspergillus lucknowensis TaxID=176173 RepID=A0ABR4LS10_9EURO